MQNYLAQEAHLFSPSPINLLPDEVHLWQINLLDFLPCLDQMASLLTADEQARAEGFVFAQHRERYILCRSILRTLLGRYLQVEAAAIRFQYQPEGKPFLDLPFASSSIQFNLSHSDHWALYGFVLQRLIGVDLESVRPTNMEMISQRFFSPMECSVLAKLPPEEQLANFFRLWCCREAFLKATGEGIGGLAKLASFCLPAADSALKICPHYWHPRFPTAWTVHELISGADYVATAVVQGEHLTFQTWQGVN